MCFFKEKKKKKFFASYLHPWGNYTSVSNYKLVLLISSIIIHIMNIFFPPFFPLCSTHIQATSVFAAFAFDQHDARRTSRDEVSGFPSSHFGPDHPLRRRESVEKCVLGPPIPCFYSAIFPEPFHKTHPGWTTGCHCSARMRQHGLKKEGSEKWSGEMNAPLLADVGNKKKNTDRSLNHWRGEKKEKKKEK